MKSLNLPGLRAGLASAAVWAVLVATALVFEFEPLLALQLRITDFIFVQEGGPRLGISGAHRDYVVVVHDEAGGAGTYTTADVGRDLTLYVRLLDGGAIAVGDLRFRGPGKESDDLMAGLVALEAKGLVLRQFDNRVAEQSAVSHSAPSLYWFDSSRDLAQNVRFYPLFGKHPDGLREGMALRLARAYLGLSNAGPAVAHSPGRGYELAPGHVLPTLHRPSKTAPQFVGDPALWMDYHGPPGTFPALTVKEVAEGRADPGYLRGKLVIIDVGDLGALGTPTSVRQPMTEGEMDANVVQSIVEQHFLAPQEMVPAVLSLVALAAAGGLLFSQLRPVPSVGVLVLLLGAYLAYGTALYRGGTVPDVFFGSLALLGTFVSTSVYQYIGESRARRREEEEKRRIRETFGRYVAQPVVEKLLQDPGSVALGGKRQEVTVLFADIRGYTTLSEQTSPEDVVNMLNTYLTEATGGILAQEGTVDKYIGDAIMAYFNAPLPQADHALRAIRAALEMQARLGAGQAGAGPSCGIGIHTGIAIVGNVGSPQLMSYTVIGDAVNVAARLQASAGPGEVLISEGAYDQVRGMVDVEPLEPLQVKGRTVPVPVYRVRGVRR
ncbi:MAG: adenylate/guanylate cyclase domain-containing protein [Chloroflexi bacterium]|nr:adenylate/guanylate cyclase domain-containing protein [Chloroflexota bacterium]